MNCKSDSGEFQEIESNYSRQFFTFPVNPAVVPSPQSMLSSNRSMPFDTWNLSETQGNVFGNPRFSSIQLRHLIKEFFTLRIQMPQVRFQWERIGSTTPMPICVRRPSTINSLPAEVPQNSMAVQQRPQISELLFDKFLFFFHYFRVGR